MLVKHTAGDNDTPVSWVCFKPWMNNSVEWQDDFAIYASSSDACSGATIKKLSDKQANTGLSYPFKDGYFHEPQTGENLPKNSYAFSTANMIQDFNDLYWGPFLIRAYNMLHQKGLI